MNIDNLTYSEYVSLVQETNRPSGGIQTVQRACVEAFISENDRVLEIGCNTGFTTNTIHRLTGASATGIDPLQDSVEAARETAENHGLDTTFKQADATDLPFDDESFGAVWLSNVLSFIDEKTTALDECFRVLETNGFIVFIPIYYVEEPPKELVSKVEEAIGTSLTVRRKEAWEAFIDNIQTPTVITYEEDFRYQDRANAIPKYIEEVFDKPHLQDLSDSDQEKLKEKGRYFMRLFNENLQYTGFTLYIVQKRLEEEESELFLTR